MNTSSTHIYRTRYSSVYLDEEGILWLRPDEGADLDLEEVTACFGIYRKMGIGKDRKVLQVIDARVDVSMAKEAREYAAAHGADFFIASAIISSSLPVRMMVNFFNLFYKVQVVPFRLFENEEAARRWLLKFRE
jgi:hypothetical protein